MKRIALPSLLLLAGVIAVIFMINRAPVAAEVLTHESIVANGTTRQYRLVVPEKLVTPAPVVFAFHGTGETPEAMAEYCQWDALAAREGFVLVYPAAERGMWRTVGLDEQRLDEHPDIRYFDVLLDHLSTRYPIDHRRVYLLGMSNGGMFAQLVASERPQQIAAVVSHSGPRPVDVVPQSDTPPLMLLVGAEDSAQATIRQDAETYQAAGREVEFIMISRLGHAWSVEHNAEMWRFLKATR
jgi:poly(3-hydroxybutyrate) depolymerase